MAYNILIDVPLPAAIIEMLGPGFNLHLIDETPAAEWGRIDALFTYSHPIIDGAFMDRLPNMKLISNFGVGVDHIDLDAAKQRGLPVGNTPSLLDGATADMTIALMLATARNMIIGDRFARSAEFTHYDPSILMGYEVHSTTLGIIGMGNIGYQVARRALAFDMQVLYHNRRPNTAAEAKLDVTYTALDDLLTQADFVALNTPLTPETTNLIGRRELSLMKETAFLVNTARGGVVDHDALYEALTTGQIAGAGLDVTEPEPLPRDHPLLGLDNVVIMPHLGSCTRQTRQAMAQRAIDNLKAGLEERDLITRVA
ncbi:MAG: D-glycerate dehydrogenase [Candidatus Latescibacteria bacterium]|nr:D-glycerate dehydrogenase [Candidatus Latescibacterota bacterium]